MHNNIIILNSDYILRNDINRCILTKKDGEGITTFIHPLQAMILSFFDAPLSYDDNVEKISNILHIKKSEISAFTNLLINNEEKIWIGEGKNACHFPENMLIPYSSDYQKRNYHFRDFILEDNEIDIYNQRFNIPIDTMLMINTLCFTDCVYCYADRTNRMDLQINIERICEIIDEARNLNFRSFDISGGEFFLYKHWEVLLKKLLENGFDTVIPTKVPLKKEVIEKAKMIGLKKIQISLDSNNIGSLQKMLNVKDDYLFKINQMLNLFKENNIKFRVNTIITNYNCNLQEIEDLIKYLKTFPNFYETTIGFAAFSLYKTSEENLKLSPNISKANKVQSELQTKYENDEMIIISDLQYQKDNYHLSMGEFNNRALCTGNLHSFYILPDGKVTICEELYWHPEFIIGDINKQSIMEVWNSEKAKNLFKLSREVIQQDSSCKDCDIFDSCRQVKGVCWREIIKTYGKDKWYYPDPRCPKSPEPKEKIYIG